ncbi:MAG: SurA N-terminal domain-containing protein [Patescibacteria group bacterium]
MEAIKPKRTPRWPKVVLAVVVVFIVWWYGLVYLHWNSWIVRVATNIIPFPAVMLNGESITYHDLLIEMRQRLWLAQKQNEGMRLPDDDEMLSRALESLVREKALTQLAKQEDITVEREELKNALADLQGEQTDEAFDLTLIETLNVNRDTFVDEILRPLLLAQKLKTFVLASSDYQSSIRVLAEQAQIRIVGGTLFGVILQAAQQSPFEIDGGDYGYISVGNVPDGWSALLGMGENSTSPVIETIDAFIVLVVEEVIGSGDDAQFHTKAIIFHKRGLDDVLEQYLDDSEIKQIIKGVE